MQPDESCDEIYVLVIDETYGGDEETYLAESESYRKGLEREFQVLFVPANVGAGADIPAFLTVIATTSIPLWAVLLGAFFVGKPIKENLEAWIEMGATVRRFFRRPVVFSRHGAAVLAIEAVFDEIGGMPKTVRLVSYRQQHIGYQDKLASLPKSTDIGSTPPILNLGHVQHVFEIDADEVSFRVGVSGKKIDILRIRDLDE
jgi:hypothetical protein